MFFFLLATAFPFQQNASKEQTFYIYDLQQGGCDHIDLSAQTQIVAFNLRDTRCILGQITDK